MKWWTGMLMVVGLGGGCGGEGSSGSEAAQPSPSCGGLSGYAYEEDPGCFHGLSEIPSAICLRETLPETPSSGLYPVCLVSPGGDLYAAQVGGSKAVDGSGWSHSAYGLVASTLSEAHEARCTKAMASSPFLPDAGMPFCAGASD